MNSNDIFQLIENVAATASKNEKQALVTRYMKEDLFKRVCQYAYDPFKTYGIRKRPETTRENGNAEFDPGTWNLLDDLIARRLTGNNAIDAVRGEMTALSKDSSELLWRIISKDLRAGFSESTINKASKGLIPDFPYMRCSLPKDAKLEEWPFDSIGCLSQEKADGMFANIDHEVGGLVSIRSRQGSEFPIDKFPRIVEEVKKRLYPDHQQHGEIVVVRDGVVCKREIGNGILNSVLNGGDFAENEYPVYLIWDQIPLESVVTKGKYDMPYRHRLASVIRQLSGQTGDSLMLIPTKVVKSLAEAYAHAAELMKTGKEGSVVKNPEGIWKDGTSKHQVKLKLEFEVDLVVIGIELGRIGSKNEGRPGALACETSDGKLRTSVAVKNEAMRDNVERDPEDWIDRIIPVTANDIMMPGGSSDFHALFLPRMTEANYRTDKTEADSLTRVFKQKDAAIFGKSILSDAL
jgi:DNA ligase-1